MRNRRIFAKLIDLVAFAGFVSLGQRFGGNAWTGFALGAAYLLAGDALGMTAKAWFGLGVVDAATGRGCSLASSALRNTPWLAAPLFRTAVESFSGADASPSASLARGVIGVIGIAVVVSLWRGLGDGSGRHWADVLAGTKVVKAGAAASQPRARRPGRPAPKASASGTGEDDDKDAVDFDDGEGTPRRHPPRPPARPGTDKDAIDFDDAAN